MDTALFYPGYLNLSFDEAYKQVDVILNDAMRFGGAVTFNWHDRSLAPERLWGEFYTGLVSKLKQKGAWCTSAAGAVSWFQNRRSVVFGRDDQGVEVARRGIVLDCRKGVSGLKVRVYNVRGNGENTSCTYVERALSGNKTIRFDRGSFATQN